MTDEISTPTKNSRKPNRRLVAILTAGALVLAGGITLTVVGVTNASAEETARQCVTALKGGAAATKSGTEALESADNALLAVKSLALPANDWTSTEYAARPGIEAVAAVEAVPAVEASEGFDAVAAVAGVEKITARASGAEQIVSVTDARATLAKVEFPTRCTERDEAATIVALTTKSLTATAALDTSAAVLIEDFAAFQVDETARIAAEIEAARIAAEIEAARVTAEAEAARVAAAAARAAQRPSAQRPSSGGGGASPAPAPRPRGGGLVGPSGNPTGACLTDNGYGGVKACGT